MESDNRRRGGNAWPDPWETEGYTPYRRRFEIRPGSSRALETVTIGGKTYTEYDDGRQNKLIPIQPSPAELEARQHSAARLQAQLSSPVGGAAYGIAAAMGASQQARDMALAGGMAADTGMMGLSPRGAAPAGVAPVSRRAPLPPGATRLPYRYAETNELQQAQRGDATLQQSLLGGGKRVNKRLTPPGWLGDGKEYKQARGHLIAKMLGGTGNNTREVVTLWQNPVNHPQMSGFEREAAKRVRGGEIVEYSSIPLYNAGKKEPDYMLLTARGSRGEPVARLIRNVPGKRR